MCVYTVYVVDRFITAVPILMQLCMVVQIDPWKVSSRSDLYEIKVVIHFNPLCPPSGLPCLSVCIITIYIIKF